MHFFNLPHDVLILIVCRLPVDGVISCSKTCRQLRQFVKATPLLFYEADLSPYGDRLPATTLLDLFPAHIAPRSLTLNGCSTVSPYTLVRLNASKLHTLKCNALRVDGVEFDHAASQLDTLLHLVSRSKDGAFFATPQHLEALLRQASNTLHCLHVSHQSLLSNALLQGLTAWLPHLVDVDLSFLSQLTNEGLQTLLRALADRQPTQHLTSLRIFGMQTTALTSLFIAQHAMHLERLYMDAPHDLRGNGSIRLGHMLSKLTSLRDVSIRHLPWSNGYLENVTAALAKLPHLKRLYLTPKTISYNSGTSHDHIRIEQLLEFTVDTMHHLLSMEALDHLELGACSAFYDEDVAPLFCTLIQRLCILKIRCAFEAWPVHSVRELWAKGWTNLEHLELWDAKWLSMSWMDWLVKCPRLRQVILGNCPVIVDKVLPFNLSIVKRDYITRR
jgi:hypothetical protein